MHGAVPPNLRVRGGHFLQGLQGIFRPVFLYHAQHRVQHHNQKNNDAIRPLLQCKAGDNGGDQQDQHHHVLELLQEHLQRAAPSGGAKLVLSVFFLALRYLGGFQPCLRRYVEFAQGSLRAVLMPVHAQPPLEKDFLAP